ncbi:MAG TPA: hypothetical protein PKA58_00560 [Polyangium sp.]|nr:hypothetical protein [Polyangium sp.]
MNFDPFKFQENRIIWGLLFFVVGLVLSTLATIFVIIRLPANYFIDDGAASTEAAHPPWRRVLGTLVKNLIGVGLVILGLVMALPGVPGQGLLTIFIGIVLLDVPGKREFEKRIISKPSILRACNRLRARFGKEALRIERTPALVGEKNEASVTDERDDDHGRAK